MKKMLFTLVILSTFIACEKIDVNQEKKTNNETIAINTNSITREQQADLDLDLPIIIPLEGKVCGGRFSLILTTDPSYVSSGPGVYFEVYDVTDQTNFPPILSHGYVQIGNPFPMPEGIPCHEYKFVFPAIYTTPSTVFSFSVISDGCNGHWNKGCFPITIDDESNEIINLQEIEKP